MASKKQLNHAAVCHFMTIKMYVALNMQKREIFEAVQSYKFSMAASVTSVLAESLVEPLITSK